MKNLGLKALSLAIAVVLVVFARSDGNMSQVAFLVPVEVDNIPPGFIVTEPRASQVSVTVKGPAFLVDSIPQPPPPVRIVVPENNSGKFSVKLLSTEIDLPLGVEVVVMDPPTLEIEIQRKGEKAIEVEVPKLGSLPAGLVLQSVEATPAEVKLFGPVDVLKRINLVELSPIDLRQIRNTQELTLEVRNLPELVTAEPMSVNVKVTVYERSIERRFSGIRVAVQGQTADLAGGRRPYTVSPENVAIELSGPQSALNALGPPQPFVILPTDRGGLDKRKGALRLKVQLPELQQGLQVVGIEPSEVVLKPVN